MSAGSGKARTNAGARGGGGVGGRAGGKVRSNAGGVSAGDVFDVEVRALAHGGDGVATLPCGMTAFVPGAVPGDVISVEVTHVASAYARAKMLDIVSPSAHRVKPACPYAGACGGCPWQHISYEAQLEWKRRAVCDALERTARMPSDVVRKLVRPCVASKRQWHYRNKVEFEVAHIEANGQSRLTLGFHGLNSTDVVPVQECLLLPKKLTRAPKSLTGALRFASAGDLTSLDIERVGLRVSLETGQREVAIWTKPSAFPRKRVAKILTDALHANSIVRVLAKGQLKERKVAGVEKLYGPGWWLERLHGEEMRISAPSFFQVNTAQAEKLIELVCDGLRPRASDIALDLYCGAGTFTLPLARKAGEVIAVEVEGSSVHDLERNLFDAGLDADVIADDVARALPGIGHADIAVVDPPRSGLSSRALAEIAKLEVRRLAYVSCDPVTLARDIAVLAGPDGPFRLERATPVDMFPQTCHVETVAIMSRA